MSVDRSKLIFYSGDPIDKIVGDIDPDIVQVTNSGATSNDPFAAKIVESTISNPYGKKCLVRFKWSIDDSNFDSPKTHLYYLWTLSFTGGSEQLGGLKGAVSVGVSDSTITFRTANGDHGDASVTSTVSGNVYTYTPTSHTFYIQYVLFEVD